MSASTAFSQVEKMLKECAPGHTIRRSTHGRVIQFGDKLFRNFPKHDPVENGWVRKLARNFNIEACASKRLPTVVKAPAELEPPEKPVHAAKPVQASKKK